MNHGVSFIDAEVERIGSFLYLFALVIAGQLYEYAHVPVEIGLGTVEVERANRYIVMVS